MTLLPDPTTTTPPKPSPKSPKVLVFDSGAGGLSIAAEILLKTPGVQLSYLADTAGFPYGVMKDDEVVKRITHAIESSLEKNIEPDLVVVACNTASTLALDPLRERFAMDFVGVVPAIKPAAGLTETGVIGLLATSATIDRTYTKQLIKDFAAEHCVISVGSSALVQLAETWVMTSQIDMAALNKALEGFTQRPNFHQMDVLVLACTHFPLIRETIQATLAVPGLHIIDSGEAIARRAEQLLRRQGFNGKEGFNVLEHKSSQYSLQFLFHCSAKRGERLANVYANFLNSMLKEQREYSWDVFELK